MTETDPNRAAPDFAVGGWDVLVALVAAFAVAGAAIVAYVFAAMLFDGTPLLKPGAKPTQGLINFGLLLEAAALVGGVQALRLRRRDFTWHRFGLRPTTRRWIWIGVGLGVLFVPLSILVSTGTQKLLGLPSESPQMPLLAPEGFSWTAYVIILVLGGILVPLAEEIFFRGLVYGWLRRVWSVPAGVMVSALIFGVIHGFVVVIVAAAMIGIALALLYEKSRSLWPSAVLHMVFNSISLSLMFAEIAEKSGASI
ncbi:MAG: type II CAAX endopeptidase family protein [Alphaproteobacteria bacterium]